MRTSVTARLFAVLAGLVLAGLGALSVSRFLDTGLRLPVLMASFSSYAVLGYAGLLLACLVALVRSRRTPFVAVAVAVVAGLAALGLVGQGWTLAPLFAGGAAGEPDLTVMTSNLEFGRGDAATVVRTVASDEVDVLVLEEVTPGGLTRLLGAGLADLLPHRVGVPLAGAAGTMVFSGYPLAAPAPFRLANGGLDIEVAAPAPFRLLAVHTAQPLGGPSLWRTDLTSVRRRALSAVDRGPTIAAGDFNATLDHEPLRAVLGTGLRDAAEQAGSGWQPTWPTRYRDTLAPRPMLTIDHVLVSEDYRAIRTRTVSVPHTDHLALVAELRLGKDE
jgi:endonuclease/exonuclease/phosphatase (EEP) superfamily protein YafD